MANIRPEFKTSLCTRLLNDIYRQRSNYYYFLGRTQPWSVSDTIPEEANDALINDNDVRDGMLFLRKVIPSEISAVTQSHSWGSGTVFAEWDHTAVMKGVNFYCVTDGEEDEYNVYKCLYNNNGAPSTIKPTGVGNTNFLLYLTDGYVWKYMYNIPSFKRQKFLSRGKMPVQKSLSDSFYTRGAIEEVIVTDSGSGYSGTIQTSIDISGGTKLPGGSVTFTDSTNRVNWTSHGYSNGMQVEFSAITSTTGISINTRYYVINSTPNYFQLAATPTGSAINLITDGTGTAKAGANPILIPGVDSAGTIQQIKVIDAGTGWTVAPTLSVTSLAGGTAKYPGNISAKVWAKIKDGHIDYIYIEDPGIGYPTNSSGAAIVSTGDGQGAAFTPVIYNGQLVDVVVSTTGQDYSYINLVVTGVSTTPAFCSAVISGADYASNQSDVEQTAIPGEIYTIKVAPGGNVTFNGTTNLVTLESHGFVNDSPIRFSSITTTTGITANTVYYIKSATANTFELSLTAGGATIDLVNNGTGIIAAGGTGYHAKTVLTINGTGTGALATPIITGGVITGVTLVNSGSGYGTSGTTVTVTGDGFNADITPIVNISGLVTGFNIVNGGTGYSTGNGTTVAITGDGVGATATCTVVYGKITRIDVTNKGSGYTYANLTFTDSLRLGVPNINVKAYAVLPPPGGHGADAMKELYADTVAVYSLIRDDDIALNALTQDYRQFGLIENPTDINTFQKIAFQSIIAAYDVVMTSAPNNFLVDEIVVCNTHRFRVISKSGTTIKLQLLGNIEYTPPPGSVISRESNPSQTYTVSAVTFVPTLDKYSGNLLYVTNRTTFTPSSTSALAVRTYLTF